MPQNVSIFAPVVTLVVGIILWLLGGRLIRVGACLMGVAIGVIVATIFISPANTTLAAVSILLAAIAGLALGWSLFRLWMGLSLAFVLAIAAPMAMLAFNGIEPPTFLNQQPESSPNLPAVTTVALHYNQPPASPMTAQQQAQVDALERATTHRLDPAMATTAQWWRDLSPQMRLDVQRYALIAGVVGLVFGLVAPLTAAALQSAVLGAVLILASIIALAPDLAPSLASQLPHDTKSFLVITLMIALIGFIFQWSLNHPKADKQSKAQTAEQAA